MSALRLLLRQFESPLVLILAFAAAISLIRVQTEISHARQWNIHAYATRQLPECEWVRTGCVGFNPAGHAHRREPFVYRVAIERLHVRACIEYGP